MHIQVLINIFLYIISGDDRGNIRVWKIDFAKAPKSEKSATQTPGKVPEPWSEVSSLSFSLYRYHDAMHPRGPVPPHARDKGSENLDSMVDISPNPLDPPVALVLCARRIDYLAGDSGSLLIGTSANSVFMVVLSEHMAHDYNAEVLLEGHTGHLRAIAAVPASSFCFGVSLEVLEQDQAVVAIKEDVGHDVKNVALKIFPSLEDTTRAGYFLQQGRLIVTRYQHQNKTWFSYDPFGRGGGEFVEQVCTCMGGWVGGWVDAWVHT